MTTLKDTYPLYLNNKAAQPNTDLEVRDKFTGEVALRTALATPDVIDEAIAGAVRAAEPMAVRWETPGGFCDGWEHPADAAVREAREELGVAVTLGDFVGMYVGSYDFQGETLPVLESFFLATIGAGEITLDPAESSGLTWFDLAKPPALAFATMDAALRDAARLLDIRAGLDFPARGN